MYFSDKITLRAVTYGVDADGYSTTTSTDTEVWANVKSASRAEFYAASAHGVNVTKVFEVNAEDWGGQSRVVYGGQVYDIIKPYQKGLGVVELTCSDKAV